MLEINLTNDIVDVKSMELFRNRDIELRHLFFLELVHHFSVRLHRPVVAVASPLHNDNRRDSEIKTINNKCSPSAMARKQFIFWIDFFYSFIFHKVNNPLRRVYTCLLPNLLELLIHSLVTYDRKNQVFLKRKVFVLIQYGSSDVV